jgi:hypothetical protein
MGASRMMTLTKHVKQHMQKILREVQYRRLYLYYEYEKKVTDIQGRKEEDIFLKILCWISGWFKQ